MGVRGFTTYMSRHSQLFFETFRLKNCYIIIDGSGIGIQLYQSHTKANDCFGGDYDNYANVVYTFFSLLQSCNVIPIILFDGGLENRKIKTVFNRMRNRIGSIKRLNSTTEGKVSVFPSLTKEVFQDIALELGIKCISNDYESDSEIACLARNLNCPILGYDSDFFFFDTLYIPFDKFGMKVLTSNCSGGREAYIPCEVYKIDKFLNYFGGLDKLNLPLLPVLFGNDYVKKKIFSAFYRHIKLIKSKGDNDQQRAIKTVIQWLRNETLESAISKILGRFKSHRRKYISGKLNNAMQGYLQVNSTLTEYLDDLEKSHICMKIERDIDIMKIKPSIEDELNGELAETSSCTEESDDGDDEDDIKSFVHELDESPLHIIQKGPQKIDDSVGENYSFIERYRKCLLPRCFMDLKMRNMYFSLPQIEDYSGPHSYSICFNILRCIHKILTLPHSKSVVCIVRGNEGGIKRAMQPKCTKNLPSFEEIQKLNMNKCKECFFSILNVEKSYENFLNNFPNDWHLFLISLYYWKNKSHNCVDSSFIYSLILCAIVLNFIDPQVGFCRSNTALVKKYTNMKKSKEAASSICFGNLFIDYKDCLYCLETLLSYFSMESKMKTNIKLFDITVVNNFSQFQSCFLHVKYLNSLFNFPFKNTSIAKFFNGTFLYNLTVNLRKRTNLHSYIETMLKDCKNVYLCFQMIVAYIDTSIGTIEESNAKKTRRRRRRKQNTKDEVENENKIEALDEIEYFDPENKYSLLQNT